MKNNSELTFNELSKDLGFIKVIWNGKTIYDDTIPVQVQPSHSLVTLDQLYKYYGNRYVYSMNIKVTAGHHCELKIKGEKEYHERQLVFGVWEAPEVYEHELVDLEDIEILEEVSCDVYNTILFSQHLSRLEDTCNKKYKMYKIRLNNPDPTGYAPKYGWLSYCDIFYIFKEIQD